MRALTRAEVDAVAGGDVDWGQVGAGTAMIGLGAALLVAGGVELAAVGAAGALFGGEALLVGFSYSLAGVGGALLGDEAYDFFFDTSYEAQSAGSGG
jgi:hypothetical protein